MRLFLSTSIATFLLASSSISFVRGYDRIIVFADSFTDNGNDYRNSMNPPSPPYWKGRFSNGPTWLEQVANELKGIQVINHGYGGATTDNAHAYSEYNGYVVPGLKQQIEQFGVEHPKPDDDLYIIYIGYNDLNAIVNPDQYHVVKPFTYNDVANSVVDGIHQLINKYGAKTFTVMTCPPFDQWPVIKPEDKQRTKQLINDYNSSLGAKLKGINNAHISVLDDHTWFEDAIAHPERFGLETDNGACIPSNNEKVVVCNDPEKHFFWDYFHPEAKVHKALGQWATNKLKEKYHFD